MSHEKNFVSELVQMARAFEELPIVQADLNLYKARHNEALENIQRLELRLIDAANEITAAHEATRKAEVERDHAETMFLETDQKLDTLRGIFGHFQAEVAGFVRASEPEPVAQPSLGGAEQSAEQGQGALGFTAQNVEAESGVTTIEPVPNTRETVIGDSPSPSQAGHPAQPSPAIPETSTDTVSNTTSPEGAGLSGPTDEYAKANLADPLPLPPLDAEVRDSVDPSASTKAIQSDPVLSADADREATASSVPTQDDVGYHNEPKTYVENYHARWDEWAERMNEKFGPGSWPARYAV